MNDEPSIRDLLESFRPGIDDANAQPWNELGAALAAEPALRRHADKVRQHDQVVRTAMHDVPPPPGLAERLLGGLELGDKTDVLSTAPPSVKEPVELSQPSPSRERVRRRVWAAALIGTIALAIVALVAGFWRPGPVDAPQITQHEVAEQLESWLKDPSLRDADRWHPIKGTAAAEARRDLNASVNVSRSQKLQTSLGSATVYELQLQGKTARLYVFHTQQSCYVAASPYTVLPGLSASRAAVAWQPQNDLYVLVLDDRDARIEDFVRVRSQA